MLNTRHGPFLTKWFFARTDQQLLGFELRLNDNEDPCEIYLSDYRPVDGRMLPHRLQAQYGDSVTYAQDSSSHLQTEFRFDVLQVAHRGEVPQLFEHSVEFKVPKEFLDRVFKETYGLGLNDLFENFDFARPEWL